jgi:hypothetical protein
LVGNFRSSDAVLAGLDMSEGAMITAMVRPAARIAMRNQRNIGLFLNECEGNEFAGRGSAIDPGSRSAESFNVFL